MKLRQKCKIKESSPSKSPKVYSNNKFKQIVEALNQQDSKVQENFKMRQHQMIIEDNFELCKQTQNSKLLENYKNTVMSPKS